MKEHRIRILVGGRELHHVGDRTLSAPVCTCGWEGAWMSSPKDAKFEGRKHVVRERLAASNENGAAS